VEHREAADAPADVRLQHNLGVRATAETGTVALESPAQLGKVVYLAVVHERDETVRGLHGLMAGGGQVEDAQTSVSEAGWSDDLHAAVVRPAVIEGCRHRPDEIYVGVGTRVIDDPADAAHQPVLTSGEAQQRIPESRDSASDASGWSRYAVCTSPCPVRARRCLALEKR